MHSDEKKPASSRFLSLSRVALLGLSKNLGTGLAVA